MIVEGFSTSGFKYKVDTETMTSWDYIEAVALSQSEDESEQIIGFVKMVNISMGKAGMNNLRKHLGQNMQVEDVNREVGEIIKAVSAKAKEVKNS